MVEENSVINIFRITFYIKILIICFMNTVKIFLKFGWSNLTEIYIEKQLFTFNN